METTLVKRSYYDILSERALKDPDKAALVMGNDRVTYSELLERIDDVALFLLKQGLKPQDKVVIWSKASPMWLCAYYGIIRAGGIAVILNANYTIADCDRLVRYADTKFMLFGDTHDTDDSDGSRFVLAGAFDLPVERVFNLGMIGHEELSDKSCLNEENDINDPAYLIYTSGTTATPKAVVTSQFGIVNVTRGLAGEISDIRGDKVCMAVPLFHAYGIMVSFIYLQNGATVYMPEKIKADVVADLIEREHITDIWSVAAIYQNLIDDKNLANRVAPIIKMCTIAGAYTSPAQFTNYESVLYNSTFINMYGMTETCAAYTLTRASDTRNVRYTTVGRPIPGVEMAVWNEERGILPVGEVGEVITRGYHLKKEYYKLPESEQAVDKDGWLHSGDLGTIDADGNLKIVGRIKDIIIKGGENIAPAEIESRVMEMPGIKECRIFGYQDRIYGENLGACITLEDKDKYDEPGIRARLKKLIGSYKTPAIFLIYDRFPLSPNGKVDQRSLRFDMWLKIGRMKRKAAGYRKITDVI